MKTLNANLLFRRNCNEAIALYEKAFGATIRQKITFGEAADMGFICQPGEENCVFYSELQLGDRFISMADDSNDILKNVSSEINKPTLALANLLVHFNTREELDTCYEVLQEGVTILTPLESSPICTGYIMLIDKFGKNWELMSGYEG